MTKRLGGASLPRFDLVDRVGSVVPDFVRKNVMVFASRNTVTIRVRGKSITLVGEEIDAAFVHLSALREEVRHGEKALCDI